eukprot:m.78107 g.78107  ORF g.78107 m.78107 type:complete len:88 (-) comp9194_c0_seq1:30-293(-)
MALAGTYIFSSVESLFNECTDEAPSSPSKDSPNTSSCVGLLYRLDMVTGGPNADRCFLSGRHAGYDAVAASRYHHNSLDRAPVVFVL